MPKSGETEKPKIFISHAWEDKPLVRRLEAELRAAGAEVWVDHEGIRGGDNLPKQISDALEWCNTLLLVWSKAAKESRWVELEWTNAISLERAIIPCLLDAALLPGILASKAYLDFTNTECGVAELLRALKLARKPIPPAAAGHTERVARVIHHQLAASKTRSERDSSKESVQSPWRSLLVAIISSIITGAALKFVNDLPILRVLVIGTLALVLASIWIWGLLNVKKTTSVVRYALRHNSIIVVALTSTTMLLVTQSDKQVRDLLYDQLLNKSSANRPEGQQSDLNPGKRVQEQRARNDTAESMERTPVTSQSHGLKEEVTNIYIYLRQTPATLSIKQVKSMLQKYRFYCKEYDWNAEWSNPKGLGLANKFEVQQEGKVIFDHASSLMWQQSVSSKSMAYSDTEEYIRSLNDQHFAGHGDWRLPTLEEVMSLMEPEKHGYLHIDPVFDRKNFWIWTADKESARRAWCVDFFYGTCSDRGNEYGGGYYVRAVRSGP